MSHSSLIYKQGEVVLTVAGLDGTNGNPNVSIVFNGLMQSDIPNITVLTNTPTTTTSDLLLDPGD